MSYLTKLRQKPKYVRDNIAFVAAGVATLPVMAYLVFAVHGPKLSDGVAESSKTDPKFFETFTNQVKDRVANVRETTSAPSAVATPIVIDRGPLDAVPVEAPVSSANTATTSFVATSSAISTYTITPAAR